MKILEHYFNKEIPISLSWKLHAFYLGLILISISAIIFIIACPNEIKKHDNDSDYVDFERKIYTKNSDLQMSSSIGINPIKWENPMQTYGKETGSFPLVRIYEANEEKIVNQLKLVFLKKNQSLWLVRLISLSLFLAGLGLTLLPTASTICWSISQLGYTLSL